MSEGNKAVNRYLTFCCTVVIWLAVAPVLALQQMPEEGQSINGLSLARHFFVLGDHRRVRGQWGSLPVPENWRKPEGRKITLTFAVLPSTSPTPMEPVYFAAGGPGASSIGGFSKNADMLLAIREFADVVLVEQRGAGFSRPLLDCAQSWDFSMDAPLSRSALIEAARERFAACRREWAEQSVDLGGYNTVAYARDIVAVADALGHQRFGLLAYSYGTQIGLELARQYPERLTRAALLGVMGPADSLRDPRDHDAVMRRATELMETDPAAAHYPDLESLTRQTLALLRGESLQVNLTDGSPDQSSYFVLDELTFRQQLVVRLGIRDELAKLPRFMNALLNDTDQQWLRDELENRRRGLIWRRTGPLSLRSAAQHYVTVCAAADPMPRKAAPEGCLLGHTIHLELPEACDAWQVPTLGADFRAIPESDLPILMVSADLDTKTPMEQAERLLPYLRNGVHIVVKNAGHGDLFSAGGAVNERVVAFLRGQPVDTTPIELEPVRFALPENAQTVAAK